MAIVRSISQSENVFIERIKEKDRERCRKVMADYYKKRKQKIKSIKIKPWKI